MTSSIGQLRLEGGKHITKDNEMAEVLNDYFAFVFTVKDIGGTEQMLPPHWNVIPLSNCDFTEDAIMKVLDTIKVNKTPGPACIAPRVFKETKYEIQKPISISFPKSLNFSTVPREWKLANVTPIQKKGDKSVISNYRPISLTSVVCRVVETIKLNKAVSFLEDNL